MQLVSLVGMLVLSVSAADVGPAAPDAVRSPLPEPVATRQTLFSIPFQVERPVSPGQQPVETRLYVSVDQGATWHLYGQVDPTKRDYFLFRAGGDGEYWFFIRTLNRDGKLRPEQTRRPGLRVVVDTTPPTLTLEAQRGQAGQITVDWRVDDRHFDATSFKIQYRTANRPAWQPVAVDRHGVQSDGPLHNGQVTWCLGADYGPVEIRAEVSDGADNPAVTLARIAAIAPPITIRPPATSITTVPEPAIHIRNGRSEQRDGPSPRRYIFR